MITVTVTFSSLQGLETLHALKESYWKGVGSYRLLRSLGMSAAVTGGILTDLAGAINVLNEALLRDRASS